MLNYDFQRIGLRMGNNIDYSMKTQLIANICMVISIIFVIACMIDLVITGFHISYEFIVMFAIGINCGAFGVSLQGRDLE